MADPVSIIQPTRDDLAQDTTDAWLARSSQANPDHPADVGKGTLPYLVGQVVADIALPLYANHAKLARAYYVRGLTGAMLETVAAERLPLNDDGTVRLPATGGTGYAEAAKIASGGAFIDLGTTLIDQASGTRLQVLVGATYLNGDPIPIGAIDTGPSTNLAQNTLLQFDAPPPGVSKTATILEQNDGTGVLVGLTGGRNAETDTELQDRLIFAQSNPEAAGNAAEIVQVAQRTPAVPVQAAFAIPAWFGPGSMCVVFTLRPDASASRIPNSTQRGLVQAQLTAFPTDYSITVGFVLAQTVDTILGVTWLGSARGWTDLTPWPEYVAADPVHVDNAVAITTNAFRVTTSVATTAPVVGQTFAVFDQPTRTFKRKRILTVSTVVANKSWDLTIDTANAASETYVPANGAILSPYSQSLSRLVSPMLTYYRGLGPGEQFASFPDPGGRQRRWPFSPEQWPSVISNEGLVNAARASGAIADVEVQVPATPYTTTIGTPGVSVYLIQLGDFAVFPQS